MVVRAAPPVGANVWGTLYLQSGSRAMHVRAQLTLPLLSPRNNVPTFMVGLPSLGKLSAKSLETLLRDSKFTHTFMVNWLFLCWFYKGAKSTQWRIGSILQKQVNFISKGMKLDLHYMQHIKIPLQPRNKCQEGLKECKTWGWRDCSVVKSTLQLFQKTRVQFPEPT